MWLGRLVVLVAALFLGVLKVFKPETYSFIDYVNLVFHEAGHVLFMPFGWTLTILGGSLMQMIIPVGLALYFAYGKSDVFSGALCWIWASASLLNVSVYVKDAQERMLPLITDDPDTHDWWQLLSHYQALQYDDVLGNIFVVVAVLMWLWAAVSGVKAVLQPLFRAE